MTERNYPKTWEATFLPDAKIPEGATITSVCVVVFTTHNRIIAIMQPRWLDIPGGHVDAGETPEQAVIRESDEEAQITLEGLTVACVIKTERGYMVAYIADLATMRQFQPDQTDGEVSERVEMSPEEFIKRTKDIKRIVAEIVRRGVAHKMAINTGQPIPKYEELTLVVTP